MSNVILVDANSLGHFSNNGSRLSLGDMQIQAVYNFLRNLRAALAAHPHYQPIVIWDGASWRTLMFRDYKSNRDKADTKHEIALQEMKQVYKKQVPFIRLGLKLLGVPQISALNMEADDLGAILTDRYSKQGKVTLYTGDRDWLQLVGPNVTWRDFANKRVVTEKNFEEMTGVKTPAQFVEVKALSGDGGDSIPGVGGLGEKGAIDFLNTYGSFSNFLNMVILEKTVDINKLPKKLRALVEDEEKAIIFDRNIKLVDLRTPYRPKPENMVIEKGAPSVSSFRAYCDRLLFASITQELEIWLSVFPAFAKELT